MVAQESLNLTHWHKINVTCTAVCIYKVMMTSSLLLKHSIAFYPTQRRDECVGWLSVSLYTNTIVSLWVRNLSRVAMQCLR